MVKVTRKTLVSISVVTIIVVALLSYVMWQYIMPRPGVTVPLHMYTFAGGPSGGTWYLAGAAMSTVASKYIPGVIMSAEITAGSIENLKLVSTGKASLGFVTLEFCYEAWFHTGKYGDISSAVAAVKGDDVYVIGLAPIQPLYLQFITLEGKGMKSLYDLRGKRVNIGPAGSASAVVAKMLLSMLGILGDVKVEYMSHEAAKDALLDGRIDATLVAGGLPTVAYTELFSRAPAIMIEISGDILAKLMQACPFFKEATIKAGTYPNMKYDVKTICLPTLIVVNAKAIDGETIYKLLEVWHDHIDEIQAVHPTVIRPWSVKDSCPRWLVDLIRERWHPKAVEFYKSKGAWSA